MLSENMWFTWCQPSNYSIFGEGKSDYGPTAQLLLWKGSSKKQPNEFERLYFNGSILMVLSGGEGKERGPLWLKNVGQRANVGPNAHHLVVMSAILFIIQC